MIIPKNLEISGIFDAFLSSLLESNVANDRPEAPAQRPLLRVRVDSRVRRHRLTMMDSAFVAMALSSGPCLAPDA